MAGSIDKTTKVNLGILGSLVVVAAYGSFYLSSLNTSVQSMDASLKEVKRALDRNTGQIIHDGKALVVLQTQFQGLERRVHALENK